MQNRQSSVYRASSPVTCTCSRACLTLRRTCIHQSFQSPPTSTSAQTIYAVVDDQTATPRFLRTTTTTANFQTSTPAPRTCYQYNRSKQHRCLSSKHRRRGITSSASVQSDHTESYAGLSCNISTTYGARTLDTVDLLPLSAWIRFEYYGKSCITCKSNRYSTHISQWDLLSVNTFTSVLTTGAPK